ncbi:MAG: cyanophycin synthetase [Geminicoccaceae bacterium]
MLGELAGLEAVAGRGRREIISIEGGGKVALLDESYNANPVSMRAAIDVLAVQSGRRVAILGDMLELGADSERMHADLAEALEQADVGLLLLAGPMTAALAEAVGARIECHHVESSTELAGELHRWLKPGDAVLVKGSLGSRMQLVVDAIRGLGQPVDAGAREEV